VARFGLILGAAALVAVGGTALGLTLFERTPSEAPAAGKVTDRLGVDAADSGERVASAGRPPVHHVLPSFKWFGERDESRLPGRHLGSYVDVIETDDGVMLILDDGNNVVYEHNPEAAETTIAGDYPIPSVTPRQAFDTADEIDIKVYEPSITVAGDISDGSAAKGDRLPAETVQ